MRRSNRMDPSANKKPPTDQYQHYGYSNNSATTHATLPQNAHDLLRCNLSVRLSQLASLYSLLD